MRPPFRAYDGDQPYVFVSYAHADKEVVYPEIEHLHRLGYRIWFDEGIKPSAEWAAFLAEKIERCSAFLLFVTPRAADSWNVQDEIHHAATQRKQMLPVYLEPAVLPKATAFQLARHQGIMAHEMTGEESRRSVREALSWDLVEGGAPRDVLARRERRPTLFIGLGGTGVKVLTRVKAQRQWSPGGSSPDVAFLALDTDDTRPVLERESAGTELRCELDRNGEFLHLDLLDPAGLVRSSPGEYGWCPDPPPSGAIHAGTGGVRIAGRLALNAHAPEVFRRIRQAAEKLRSTPADFEIEEVGDIDVVLVASLAGGTGSGAFLDLGLFCSNELAHVTSVRAVLVGPETFSKVGMAFRFQANALAALDELDRTMKTVESLAVVPPAETGWGFLTGAGGGRPHRPPFDAVFLCDARNLDGQSMGSVDSVLAFVAAGVLGLVASGIPAPRASYASLGISSLALSVEQHVLRAGVDYGRRLLDRLLAEASPGQPIHGRIGGAVALYGQRFGALELGRHRGFFDGEVEYHPRGTLPADPEARAAEDARSLFSELLLEEHRGEGSGPEQLVGRICEVAGRFGDRLTREHGGLLSLVEGDLGETGGEGAASVPLDRLFDLAAPLVSFDVAPTVVARSDSWSAETWVISADPIRARALLGRNSALGPEETCWATHDDPTRICVLRLCAGFDLWSLADLDRWREKYERIESPTLHTSRYFERVAAGRSSARSG